MPSQQLINSIVLLLFGAVLSFVAAWYWFHRNAAAKEIERLRLESEKRDQRISDLEKQLSLVGQTILPISAAFQAILIKELTHFHTPAMDALLVKLGPPYSLTSAEEVELVAALEQRTQDMGDLISDSERDAARMLPMVMKRVRAELAALNEAPTQLKLVTVAPEETEQVPEVEHDE